MRCLVVSCVYPPEPVVSARTSRDVARALAARGHDVCVVAPFPNRPAGRLYEGYHRRWRERRVENDGIEVVRCFSFFSRGPGLASRLLESVSFALTAGWLTLRTRRPAVIYGNTWPLVGSGVLSAVGRWRHIPVVLSVQDLYPESLVSQGRIRAGGRLARWLVRLDGAIARGSAALLPASESFERALVNARGVPAEKVHVVPNWIDGSDGLPADGDVARVREAHGIPAHGFVVGYGGNISTAAGIEGLIDAFVRVPRERGAYLLIAGEGSHLAACRELAARRGDGRIRFHSPWPEEETAAVLRAADLLIVPTFGAQSQASIPSKVMTYLLSGRPVLAVAAAGSDLARTIEQSEAGWVVEPGSVEALAGRLDQIAQLDAAERGHRGQRGRDFALKTFAAAQGAEQIVAALEAAASEVSR